MGAETPHKKQKPPSTYVYNMNPKGYFGENAHSSDNRKDITDQQQPLDASHNQDEHTLLPPLDFRPEASAVLVEESRPINISLIDTPRITYIAASLPQEQADLLI